jgi:hypothetical protein
VDEVATLRYLTRARSPAPHRGDGQCVKDFPPHKISILLGPTDRKSPGRANAGVQLPSAYSHKIWVSVRETRLKVQREEGGQAIGLFGEL